MRGSDPIKAVSRKRSVPVLAGISVGVTLLTATHIVSHAEPTLARVIGLGAVLFPGVLVFAGAAWLLVGDFTPDEADRVVGWSIVGAVAITLLAGIILAYQHTHGVSIAHPLIVTSWIAGGGSVGGFLTGVHDVYRRRRSHRLEGTARRLRAIIGASPVAIVTLDEDGTVTGWSEAAEELFGWERRELLGEPYPLIPEDCDGEFEEHLRHDGDGFLDGVETKRRCKDGTLLDVRLWSAPVNSSGTTREHVVAIADITDQVERQQELRLLQRAIEQAEDAVLITDRNGVIEYVNEAFTDLTGYDRETAIGRTPRLLKSGDHDEEFYADLWDTITGGEVWQGEVTNQRKSGEQFTVELTIAPVEEEGEITHFVAIERDVTDRKHDKQRLNVLNRVLRHDIRNTTTVLRGNAAAVEQRVNGDATVQEPLERIQSRVDDLQSIVEKARTIERALDTDEVQPMNLAAVLSEHRVTVEEWIESGYLDLDVPDDLWVVGNPALEAAIEEAIRNAFEHTSESEPTVRVVARSREDDTVALQIVDGGPGVPDHERRIIENGQESELRHGSGIGLWMMKWIVGGIGGDLAIEESDTGGTVVTFTLPQASPLELTSDG